MKPSIMCSWKMVVVVVLIGIKSNTPNSTSLISSFCYVDTDTTKFYGKNMNMLFKSPSLLLNQKSFCQKITACIRGGSTTRSTQQRRAESVKHSDIKIRECNIRLLLAIAPVLSSHMDRHHTDAHWKIKSIQKV